MTWSKINKCESKINDTNKLKETDTIKITPQLFPTKPSSDEEGIHNIFNNIFSWSQEKNSKVAKKLNYGDKEVGDTNKEIDANLTPKPLGNKETRWIYVTKPCRAFKDKKSSIFISFE